MKMDDLSGPMGPMSYRTTLGSGVTLRKVSLLMPNYCRITREGDRWKVRDLRGAPFLFTEDFPSERAAEDAVRRRFGAEGMEVSTIQEREGSFMVSTRPAIGAPKEGVTLTLTIWPELNDLLDNLADEIGVPKGEAVVKAINLLKIAVEARREGKKLIVLDDATGEEEEITGI